MSLKTKVPFFYLLKYDFYVTPEIVTIILPISILTAVLLTFSLMSKNNEVIAVQVSGISLFRLALPAVFLGLFLSLATFFIQENILPEANRQATRMQDVILNRKSYADIEFARNWVLGKDNQIYFYNFLTSATSVLSISTFFTWIRDFPSAAAHLGPFGLVARGKFPAAQRRFYPKFQRQFSFPPAAFHGNAAANYREPGIISPRRSSFPGP